MVEHAYDHTPSGPVDDRPRRTRLTGRLVWGLVLLGLGAAWTLDNLGLADSDAIVRWWPLLLIAFGAAKFTGWGARRSQFAGTLYLIAGGWLLLHALGVVRTGIGGLWPLALVLIGGRIVLHSMRAPRSRSDQQTPGGGLDENGRVHVDAVMSGVERRIRGGVFGGGDVNAVMAGIELDLRDTTLAEGDVVLEANAVMGGIEVFVPRGWRVASEVSCVMGAVEDHTERPSGDASTRSTLVLRGATVMGGIEIKH